MSFVEDDVVCVAVGGKREWGLDGVEKRLSVSDLDFFLLLG